MQDELDCSSARTLKEVSVMKKSLFIALALCLLFAAFPAHAWIYLPETIWDYSNLPPNPKPDYFVVLRAWPDEDGLTMTVQLNEPVDELYVNWMGKDEEPQRLEIDEELKAGFSLAGHKYQPGAAPNVTYNRLINLNSRISIPFGASEAQIKAAKENAGRYVNTYCPCVSVDRPRWEVRRVYSDGSYCVLTSYDQDFPVKYIEKPEDAVIVAVDGRAYAWRQEFIPTDGGPNEAYLTLQKGWHVVYDRTGNVQYFYRFVEDTEYFGLGPATAMVRYEKSNGEWHCRQVTEMYEDGSSLTAYYSKTGSGKLVNAESYGLADEIWPSWRTNQ